MRQRTLFQIIFLFVALGGCKEKYVPKTSYPPTGYLVIDGHIDAGGGLTTFRLSRSVPLDYITYIPEYNAGIAVESEDNQSYALSETGGGFYGITGIPINAATRYRLRISTQDGRSYLSDFVETRVTPAVDSISWAAQALGVQLSVSTHDPSNKTIYYKWHFEETWKYNARYFSSLIYLNDELEVRPPEDDYFTCWKSDTSSDILLGSTAKLSSDVIFQQPMTFIPFDETFNKLYDRYSIHVTEEALTQDEYEWYDKLRKNNESLGSIFDAQPSDITGNFHCLTDPTEPVIGYLGCHTQTSMRIFINRGQLPSMTLSDGNEQCEPDTLKSLKPEDITGKYSGGGIIPTSYLYNMGFKVGVLGSSADCVDCREKGGSTTRPDFWQD